MALFDLSLTLCSHWRSFVHSATVDVQIWHPVERGYCITICRLLYIPEGYEIPQLHGGAMKGAMN